MGYVRGVIHGMMVGTAVALLYAPKPGRELREDLAQWFDRMRGQVQPVLNQAQDVVESARPQVQKTISRAQQRITRKSSEQAGAPYAGPSRMGIGGTPGPGT